MIDELGGLPAHPLLVHLPVVLVPLAAIGAIAMLIRPRWLATFGPVVAGMSGLGFVAAVLAASTGEALEDDFRESGQTISDTLRDHAEMGESARLFTALFFIAILAWVLVARRRSSAPDAATPAVPVEVDEASVATVSTVGRSRRIVAALGAVAVLAGGVATVSVYLTGHSGASSVWEEPEP